MKKIIAITFMFSLLASAAFAVDVTNAEFTGEPVISGTDTISVLSNNVGIVIVSNPTAYAAITAHLNGSKQYGSSSESTKLYSSAFEEGTTELLTPSNSESTDFNVSGTWKPL